MTIRYCLYCGSPWVDPHHEPRKGMGGSKKWMGLICPLCRIHHDSLHEKKWRLEVTVKGYSREGELLFTRRLETDPA